MVGVVNTFIDLGIFLAAYNVLKLPLIPANVLAWLLAVSGSYVMNSFITFAAESGRRLHWRAYGAFVASGVAGVITGRTEREITIHLKSGDLLIEWRDNNHVYMTGGAEEVFHGTVKIA